MEENVWSNKEVYEILKDEIILISLYVDDRSELPENKKFKLRRSNGTVTVSYTHLTLPTNREV